MREQPCTAACQHIGPGNWPHDTKMEEDRGEIHTDDCGFMRCEHDHDPGECCTAGEPGVSCRVFSRLPPTPSPKPRRGGKERK